MSGIVVSPPWIELPPGSTSTGSPVTIYTVPPAGAAPVGITGQLQYNSAGYFGAASNVTYDGINLNLGGTPTAPTATAGTNTTQIATTAYVLANSAGLASNTFSGNQSIGGTLSVTGASTLTSAVVSGNLTVQGTSLYCGPGGTSAGPLYLWLNGANDAAGGSAILLLKNSFSTPDWAIGHNSSIFGSGSGSDLNIYSYAAGVGLVINKGSGALIVQCTTNSTLPTNGALQVTGGAGVAGQVTANAIATAAPSTKTTAYTMLATDSSLIFNGAASITLTLQAASGYPGRWLYVKTIAAFTVISASSNVVPIGSATAGTAILTNTAGKWAFLQSDGTNWVVMATG